MKRLNLFAIGGLIAVFAAVYMLFEIRNAVIRIADDAARILYKIEHPVDTTLGFAAEKLNEYRLRNQKSPK